jgi:putative aldouronate transport system permease protein
MRMRILRTDGIILQNIKEFKKLWQLHLFILVPVIYILIFKYYPMLGVQIAFKDFMPTEGIWGSPWVGFKHFKNFFKSYQFVRVISNTLRISIYYICVSFPIPILFALLLNTLRNLWFKKFVQTVTYIPHFISLVVLVGMMIQFLNPVIGVLGTIYRAIYGGGYPPDVIANPSAFIHLYVWSGVWKETGWNSIIYIAALSSVDIQLYDAADIDGASRWKKLIYIDLPSIMPTIAILLILKIGHLMDVGFEQAYLMQNSLNLSSSEIISTYVYKVGLKSGLSNFSYASAIGMFNSVIDCILLFIVNRASKKLTQGDASLW